MSAASGEILDECIACGGSVTGEHGIGVEKMGFMRKLFSADDLDVMTRLRVAFNPDDRLSPGKMLPTAGACGMEQKHPGRPRGAVMLHEARAMAPTIHPLTSEPSQPTLSTRTSKAAQEAPASLPLSAAYAPSDAAELAGIVAEAHAAKTVVYPWGGATSLDYGLPARQPGWGLSLAGLGGTSSITRRTT